MKYQLLSLFQIIVFRRLQTRTKEISWNERRYKCSRYPGRHLSIISLNIIYSGCRVQWLDWISLKLKTVGINFHLAEPLPNMYHINVFNVIFYHPSIGVDVLKVFILIHFLPPPSNNVHLIFTVCSYWREI